MSLFVAKRETFWLAYFTKKLGIYWTAYDCGCQIERISKLLTLNIVVYMQRSHSVRVSDYIPQKHDEWAVSEATNGSNYDDDDDNEGLVTQSVLPGKYNVLTLTFPPPLRSQTNEMLWFIQKGAGTFL